MAFAASVVYIAMTLNPGDLADAARAAADDPLGLAVALGAYALAFALRAGLWCRALPGLGFGQSLAAIHVSLAGNHLLPLKLGEPLRVWSAVRRSPVPLGAATASTILLRAADVLAVVAIAAALGPGLAEDLVGGAGIPLAVLSALALVGAAAWLARAVRRLGPSRGWLALALPGAAAAWLLESVLVWTCAGWAGVDLSPRDAALVTAVTIAAQFVAITPGGVGTYEAAATAAMVALGADPGAALAAAVAAHALKTAYALVAGAVGAVHPAPGLLGRFRLPRGRPPPPAPAPAPPGPVVLVLPAHDEEATVAAVVARAPAEVAGREVRVLVVDDGSRDATAARGGVGRAPRWWPWARNRGLGAAVRRGLAEAVDARRRRGRVLRRRRRVRARGARGDGGADPRRARPTTSSARASPAASSTCAPTAAPATWSSRGCWRSPPGRASPTARAATAPCRAPPPRTPRSSTTSTTPRC